ncbi:hypothetical protein S83_064501 [Arachis hypogaea]
MANAMAVMLLFHLSLLLLLSSMEVLSFPSSSSSSSSFDGNEDRIGMLPGQPENIEFEQFSGYVTVDQKKHKNLFYYFVESQTHPSSKPLVLWLNAISNK